MSQIAKDLITRAVLSYDVMEDAKSMMEIREIVTERQKLVAVALQLSSNLNRTDYLKSIQDTTFTSKTEDYLAIAEKFGFERAGEFTLYRTDEANDPCPEKQFVYGIPDLGIILNLQTSRGNINTAQVHYAWRPPVSDMSEKQRIQYSQLHRGGSWESPTVPDWRAQSKDYGVFPPDLFWFGHHDGREALCFYLRKMLEVGRFHKVWPKSQACEMFGLCNDWDYNAPEVRAEKQMYRRGALRAISLKRLRACAPWLQEIVGVNY